MIKKIKEVLKKTFVYTIYMFLKEKKNKAIRQSSKFYNLKIKYPRQYRKYKKDPVNQKKIVFVENRLPSLPNSFQLIYNKLANEYDCDLHVHFLRMTFTTRKDHRQRVMDMLKDIATAKYIFISEGSNILSSFKLREETKLIQTWHGCGAFKKFGYSTMDLIFGDDRRQMKKYPFHRNYSYVTISSSEVKWAYEEAMNLPKGTDIIVDTGVSRTDIFYDKDFINNAYKKLYRIMPSAQGKKVVLYSPTFRGRVAKAQTPNLLNIEMFYEKLSDDHVLLFKHHPIVKKQPAIPLQYAEFAYNMSNVMTIEELLCVSDICISDYSSLVYEYSIFERPMLFFAYDIDEYFDWRGFYYPFDELVPGPVVTTNKQMINYIKNIDKFDKARVTAFRNKFMHRCDGHATERLLRLVLDEEMQNGRKETISQGNYASVPSSAPENKYSLMEKRLDRLRSMKKKASAVYAEHSGKPVVKNRIIVLSDSSKFNDELSYLLQRLEQNNSFEVIPYILDKEKWSYIRKAKRISKVLATAAYVIVASNVDLINGMVLRKETKVIQLGSRVYPLEKFGYDSLETRSGIRNEYLREAPDYGQCHIMPIASKGLKDIFSKACHLKEEQLVDIGIPRIDALLDHKFHQQTREKLEEMMPSAVGKKVIMYMPTYRTMEERPNKAVLLDLQRLYEACYKDYIIMYYYDSRFDRKIQFNSYYKKFAIDMTEPIIITQLNIKGEEEPVAEYEPLSVLEGMAIADIFIGDYNELGYDFAIKEKPMFFYSEDRELYYDNKDTYFSYESDLPGVIIENTKDLAKAMTSIDTYDYSKIKEFKQKYLSNCDGNSIDKLIQYMQKQ